MKAEPLLEIKQLSISFTVDNVVAEVIRDINLHVNYHETLALVGESGSGKSVTGKAILGVIANNGKINSGEIIFALKNEKETQRLDLTKLSEKMYQKQIRGKKIAIIFQDPMTALNPTMRIGRQIMESMLEHKKVNGKGEAKFRAQELLELVGISQPEKTFKQYPHQLSGGMRQRVVIAIALACEPDLLIADEPTTALDVTIQAQILELIKSLQERLGFSVIFITHDLGVVANIADRIAVMYAGKIVEEGLVDEIFYNPLHPYTWGLLSSLPSMVGDRERLYSIPGAPPSLAPPPTGDAFAYRNKHALKIDFEIAPPLISVTDTHRAASWLLDARAPFVARPHLLQERLAKLKEGLEDELK